MAFATEIIGGPTLFQLADSLFNGKPTLFFHRSGEIVVERTITIFKIEENDRSCESWNISGYDKHGDLVEIAYNSKLENGLLKYVGENYIGNSLFAGEKEGIGIGAHITIYRKTNSEKRKVGFLVFHDHHDWQGGVVSEKISWDNVMPLALEWARKLHPNG